MRQKEIEPMFVTRKEAAELLRVSPRTVDRMVREGRLRAVRPSPRRVLITLASIRDLARE